MQAWHNNWTIEPDWQAATLEIEIVVYKNLPFVCGIDNSIIIIMVYAYAHLNISHIVVVQKYMDFEIIMPNNGYDDEVNLNYTNALKFVAIHVNKGKRMNAICISNESEANT